jgi:ParB family chromosome partitioning protein
MSNQGTQQNQHAQQAKQAKQAKQAQQSLIYWISPDALRPCPGNPRRYFDDEALDDLAKSLREQDFIHAITVIDDPDHPDRWLIIAGERRWLAAQRAGLKLVPTVRRRNLPNTPNAILALQLAENLEHEPLSTYEETIAILDQLGLEIYERMPDQPEYPPNDEGRRWVAQLLRNWVNRPSPASRADTAGTARLATDELKAVIDKVFRKREGLRLESFVSNRLRYLDVPDDVKHALEAGTLHFHAAGSIGRVEDPEKRQELLEAARSGTGTRTLIAMAIEAKRAEDAPNDSDEARVTQRRHEVEPYLKQLNGRLSRITDLDHNRYQAALAALKKLSKALAD